MQTEEVNWNFSSTTLFLIIKYRNLKITLITLLYCHHGGCELLTGTCLD